MKKLIIVLVTCFPLFCTAGWKEVSKNVEYTSYYVDAEKLKRAGKFIFIWYLVDHVEPRNTGDMSEIHYLKILCRDMRYMRLKSIYFGGNMGMGQVTDDYVPLNFDQWQFPREGTAFSIVVGYACGLAEMENY